MKTRQCFVSNSSSSNFILNLSTSKYKTFSEWANDDSNKQFIISILDPDDEYLYNKDVQDVVDEQIKTLLYHNGCKLINDLWLIGYRSTEGDDCYIALLNFYELSDGTKYVEIDL